MAYNIASPYALTQVTNGGYLDIMTPRPFPALDSDVEVTLSVVYNLRPDMLAYDLYGDSRLWWVFAARNPDKFINPLVDFVTGTTLRVPNIETLKTHLGV